MNDQSESIAYILINQFSFFSFSYNSDLLHVFLQYTCPYTICYPLSECSLENGDQRVTHWHCVVVYFVLGAQAASLLVWFCNLWDFSWVTLFFYKHKFCLLSFVFNMFLFREHYSCMLPNQYSNKAQVFCWSHCEQFLTKIFGSFPIKMQQKQTGRG